MARDFSCSLITSENELLASAEGLPVHVIGTEFLAEAMTELHPDFADGDAFLHNDPYIGNTHPADHAILVPVFVDGEHMFTACAKSHQADCGNALPTTYMPAARDVYEEGALIFPCVRVQHERHDIDDIIRMCRRRIRVPDQWYGDYLATLGAARIGERRLKELCEQYGRDVVRRSSASGLTTANGGWSRRSASSRPASSSGGPRTIPTRASRTAYRSPSRLRSIPTRGSSNSTCETTPTTTPGGLNESRACATNNVITGVFNSIDPDVPHNAGSFRRISVLLREGCIAGVPRFPHSCSMATTNIADRLVCLTQAAFAELGEGFGLAEGALGMGISYAVISGLDARLDSAPYVNQIFLGSTGGPGGPLADGWPTYYLPGGGIAHVPRLTEVDEQKYPIHVHAKRLIPDSEGPGRHRGALGSEVVYGPKNLPMMIAYTFEGHENPARGVRGG